MDDPDDMEVMQSLVSEIEPSSATMRTLVGVEGDGFYGAAIDLLGRLRFAGNRLTLAHIAARVSVEGNPGTMVYDYKSVTEIEQNLRTAGEHQLDEAGRRARTAGFADDSKTEYIVGNTSAELLDLADKARADLVAIGSRGQGAAESFFLGSVGRAFAIGSHQSYLVARGEPKTKGPVRAVFATDQSVYADRCFARLLDMNPQGLAHVTVVTAMDPSKENQFAATGGSDDRTPYMVTHAEECMRQHGLDLVARLVERGIGAEFRFAEGHPADALREAMDESSSDLMILGAKGHGLFDRIFIGSLALHAVVAEPYSVLVLRMSEEA